MGVSFARGDEHNNAHPDVPGYCLVGPNGHLLRDGVIELMNGTTIRFGRLSNVVEGSNDSYYAVGFLDAFQEPKGLLVRINKTSLDAQTFEIGATGYGFANPLDIVNVSSSNDNYLLLSGWVKTETGDRKRWIASYNYNGTKMHEMVMPLSGNLGEEGKTLLTEVGANGIVDIYCASSISIAIPPPGSTPNLRRQDSDILMSKITYNSATGSFTETNPVFFNSITQRPYTSPGITAPITVAPSDIFATYPPNFSNGQYDKYPYGPRYLGTSFQRNFDNCNEESPQSGFLYVEDWSDGSEDAPYSMVSTANEIVVSAQFNRLVMWAGGNQYLGADTEQGLHCDEGPCSNFDSDYYLWGESYLLFFNKTNLTLNKATYLGTMSGGDFIPKVIKTSDGGFAVSGTVTGCPDELPTVDGAEHMMVIKVNADGSIAWRKHFNGPGEGACGFAITEAPDGGLVVAGNTEGDGQEHEENYGFIKFSGGLCAYDDAEVLPNSGNDYIVAADEPEWNTDKTVKAHVIVLAGRVLSIKGTAANPITIRFADSKEVFDFNNRSLLGITVQPGGRVYVNYATLTGFDCNGVQKMWDGINVEGQPGLNQTLTANQGFATFVQANIVNARQGTVASAVWASQTDPTINTYAGTGSQSSSVNSTLHHGGPYGGGRIIGVNSKWVDNKRSLIFMQYPHNWNNSRFWNCNFISNGPLADPNEMLPPIANNYNYNEPRGTSIHCSIWSTRVRFDNCTFTGSTSIIPDYRPFGVEGDDPKITVVGGSMNDLKIGAECRGPLGGILANLNASGVTFNNVIQGINLRNSVADVVSGCTFTSIPAPNTFAGLTPTGIFGQYNKGGLIQNNEFYGADPDNKAFGLVEHNTSNQGCEIKENKFFDARYGSQFEGDNSELTANCNDYASMGFSAWSAVKTGGFGALQDQGSSDPNESKADNEFFDFCDGAWERHIFSEFAFNYYDKTGNPHPADEDCVSDIVNLSIDINDPTAISCFVPDPCNPPTPDCRLAQFMASTKTIRDRNTALRGMIHTGTAPDTTDLPAAYDYALTVLSTRNQPEDRTILVGSLASMGLYSEAQTENNLLPTSAGEYGAYRAYLNNILGTSTDLYALPQANYNTALASLAAENVSMRAMAENLHYMREGVYHPLIAIDPESGERGAYSKPAVGSDPARLIMAYPNPFKDEVVFDLSGLNAKVQYQVVLTDLYGRTVTRQQAQGGQLFIWSTAQIHDGQYFYQILSEKEIVRSGKLLKISK